jgi:hypothetical protein
MVAQRRLSHAGRRPGAPGPAAGHWQVPGWAPLADGARSDVPWLTLTSQSLGITVESFLSEHWQYDSEMSMHRNRPTRTCRQCGRVTRQGMIINLTDKFCNDSSSLCITVESFFYQSNMILKCRCRTRRRVTRHFQ